MKNFIAIIILSFFTSVAANAGQPAGKGVGNANSAKHANKVMKHDGVISTKPPGLRGKDTPPGLSKQNKTPPGWSKGEKEGWDKDYDDDNVFSRTWHRFINWF